MFNAMLNKSSVCQEKQYLDEHLKSLRELIIQDDFKGMSAENKKLILNQESSMSHYSSILDERIRLFNK